MTFQDLFPKGKAVIAMIHLKGSGPQDRLDRAKREIDMCYRNGVDAVLVENYFGRPSDCERALNFLQKEYADRVYGVNILGNTELAFQLANRYGAKFIQIDSVSGHLPPSYETGFDAHLAKLRAGSEALVFGGVRFKYQPVLSGRTVEEDLAIGTTRCDGVVVTGDGTGLMTPEEKIAQFRDNLGDFPLITGAGVTLDTVQDTLKRCDAVIVGSWLKDGHRDHGSMNEKYVRQLMTAVERVR